MTKEGVMMLLFDLPVNEKSYRKNYTVFKKRLKKLGYLQMQESVYLKHIRNMATVTEEKRKIDEAAPEEGDVVLITLTMSQFQAMSVIRD